MATKKSTHACKYLVVTGGVLSGLGKGIAAASIGKLISNNLKIVPIKCDGYLNTDPGTMNPVEHGEVFVLDDGGEVDMDFGHYERFLGIKTKFSWNLTMGKIFKNILEKERKGKFLGQTVQFIPHVTNEIKHNIYSIAKKEEADIVLIEIGGTIGDMENEFYIEAMRQLSKEVGQDNIAFIHLTYVPVPSGIWEQKSKPTQQSIQTLNQKGIHPDIIIGRCQENLTENIKKKIALFCNIDKKHVISGVDVNSVYEIPVKFEEEKLIQILDNKLNIKTTPKLREWKKLVNTIENNKEDPEKEITIAICGKYTNLEDSYASIKESLVHCTANLNVKINIKWVDTATLKTDNKSVKSALKGVDAVIIPGGFGTRGIEGKIAVVKYVRINNIPFLGICLGMQMAVVEFARNVCNLKDANSAELADEGLEIPYAVVDILPEQKKVQEKGASMRLGGQDVEINKGTLAYKIYGDTKVRMRFRHRYEVNPDYVKELEENGLIFSGHDKTGRIKQVLELKDHKYFMACQFHPELTSRLDLPDPLFYNLIKATLS